MKFPISMLREFVNTQLDAEQIGDLLTMAGFELEGIEDVEGEPVLDIKVVSNRGDGLSVFGLSREVLAKDRESSPTDLYLWASSGGVRKEVAEGAAPPATIAIESEACSRYAARFFESANNGASPDWLQKRLRQAGMRPLGILVDLSNYVMLELGQPLHAFDLDTLESAAVIVREAKPGEKLTTLNGVEHELQAHHLCICDRVRPVALAGIMGGLETEVGDQTKRVLLESAHFDNLSVRRTRKELGLSTDASYRFERSVDPNGVVRALNRFANLLEECDPGVRVVPIVADEYPRRPKATPIEVRVSRANRLLSLEVTAEEARGYLQRLGFSVAGEGEPFVVESPSWRPDIVREIDLVEEIGRIHGYEQIPVLPPFGSTPIGGVFGKEAMKESLVEALLRLGMVQVVSHSLRDRHPLDSPNWSPIGPKNPSSPEMAYLRTSLWPCLADAALRNGGRDIHLFEIGQVHGQVQGSLMEGGRLGILSVGELLPHSWTGGPAGQADFSSMKGMVLAAIEAVNRKAYFMVSDADPRLHPSRQARILVDGADVGVMGQIHPDVASQTDLAESTLLAAIDLDALFKAPSCEFGLSRISRNPAVRRDISILISKSVPYSEIEMAVEGACGEVLEKLSLWDVYAGQGIPEGSHSLTLALQLRKFGSNFTDEEANQVRDAAVAALESLGAKQR